MSFTTTELTIEQGIELQRKDLDVWKIVLKEEVYNDLEYWLTMRNHLAEDGWDIKRDHFINGFVIHYEPYYREEVERFRNKK